MPRHYSPPKMRHGLRVIAVNVGKPACSNGYEWVPDDNDVGTVIANADPRSWRATSPGQTCDAPPIPFSVEWDTGDRDDMDGESGYCSGELRVQRCRWQKKRSEDVEALHELLAKGDG
jgi:hypothetical protein